MKAYCFTVRLVEVEGVFPKIELKRLLRFNQNTWEMNRPLLSFQCRSRFENRKLFSNYRVKLQKSYKCSLQKQLSLFFSCIPLTGSVPFHMTKSFSETIQEDKHFLNVLFSKNVKEQNYIPPLKVLKEMNGYTWLHSTLH